MLPFAAAQQTEENDIAKLTMVVDEAIESIAAVSGLSKEETLGILEEYSVAELREGKSTNSKTINFSKFNKALNKAVKAISYATALNSSEISKIFTDEKHATVSDIVNRLRDKSKQNRWHLSHY